MLQSCHVALLAEPITETGCLEWLAELRGEECQMIRRRLGDDCGQIRMHRYCQLRAGLLLPDVQHTIADMLAAHAHHVRAPLAGVEQQREREARARADGMPLLKLGDFGICPAMEAVRLYPD